MKKIKTFIYFYIVACMCLCGCENESKQKSVLDFADTKEDISEKNSKEKAEEIIEKMENAIPQAYKQIIDRAYWLVTCYSGDYVCQEGETGIVEATLGLNDEEKLSQIGYVLTDVDDNGTNELIIAKKNPGLGDRILAVYTLKNDKAILLMEGFERNRYYYLDDNSFYYEGSGGAANTAFGVYELAKDGITILTKDFYFSDFKDYNDPDSCGWFYNTSGECDVSSSKEMSFSNEEEPYDKMEKYESKTQSLGLIAFAEYGPEKNNGTESTDSNVQIGGQDVFYKTPFNENGELIEKVAINTENDKIIISKPSMAEETSFDEKNYSFSISNDWITVNYKYEIRDDIKSPVECEYYIDNITKDLPMTLEGEYAEAEQRREEVVGQFYSIFNDEYYHLYYANNSSMNVRDIWYTSFGKAGVSYLYESCTYPSAIQDYLRYNKLITEACNCYDGVTLLETVEVTYFNYTDVYEAKETTIEKNEMSSELSDIFKAISINNVSTLSDDGIRNFAVCNYGIKSCIWKDVKVIQ